MKAQSEQSCWRVTEQRGFLMAEMPVVDPVPWTTPVCRPALQHIVATAQALPDLMEQDNIRAVLAALPEPDFTLPNAIFHPAAGERLHQIYGYLANAYLWAPDNDATRRLPANLARPFVAVSDYVDRPPVLSYADSQLCNWRLKQPDGGYAPENLATIQVFQNLPDEEWFWITHSAIEAAGGKAIFAGAAAIKAAENADAEALDTALGKIAEGLDDILHLARRIEEGCRPDVFFHTLRPFLFSPEDGVFFEGVTRFDGQPQAFLGQTGAQSTLIPAISASIGLRHGKTDLTTYLAAVRTYMPKPHRQFVAALDGQSVRQFVSAHGTSPALQKRYNACVDLLIAFRKHHLQLAATYIASKVADPRGTGGTDFMRWLKVMTRETEDQRLPC